MGKLWACGVSIKKEVPFKGIPGPFFYSATKLRPNIKLKKVDPIFRDFPVSLRMEQKVKTQSQLKYNQTLVKKEQHRTNSHLR